MGTESWDSRGGGALRDRRGAALGAFVWAVLGLVFGVKHAPALDDITPLDPARKFMALLTLVIFVLIFVPVPFR